MPNNRLAVALLMAVWAGASPPPAIAKKRPGSEETSGRITALLWRAPADIASRNLLEGSAPGDAPRAPFTFEKEDLKGYNAKIVVRDAKGERWTVKPGAEARPEVAAARLVWAAGYFVTEDFFVPELHVAGLPAHPQRGQRFFKRDGTVPSVRLKRVPPGYDKAGEWQWRHNPFLGTRELNALRTLMGLINNWDLKDENNAVYRVHRAQGIEQIYLVSDLGASFGGTSTGLRRSKGDLEIYRRSEFLTKVRPGYVDLKVPSRPTLPMLYDVGYFFEWLKMRWVGRRIPRDDARWLGRLLERLSPLQIRDAFRAGGYAPEEAESFAAVVRRRIAALSEL
jgi:hypothetical protein